VRRIVKAYNELQMHMGGSLDASSPTYPTCDESSVSALHGDLEIGGIGTAQSLIKWLIDLGFTWTNRENIDD